MGCSVTQTAREEAGACGGSGCIGRAGLRYGCIPLSYAGVVIGRVPGAKALASMEEFKESLERVPPAEAGRSPGQEDKCCLLPEPIFSLLFSETRTEYLLGMSFQWC